MRCGHCGQVLRVFRLNPEKARVEPYCEQCRIYYETAPDPLSRRCSGCGLDFATIRFSERLGCSRCYDTFRDSLLEMITKERGRKPALFERPAPSRAAMARHRLLHDVLSAASDHTELDLSARADHDSGVALARTDLPPIDRGERTEPHPASLSAGDPASYEPEAGELVVRIRVARNLPDVPYLSRLPDPERRLLQEFLLADGSSVVRFFDERSTAYATVRHGARRLSANGRFEIRADDEDHLRLAFFRRLRYAEVGAQASESESGENGQGQREEQILKEIARFEEQVLATLATLDEHLWFQAHPLFGFLTACPSNAGNGMRMSLRFRRQSDPAIWLAELAALRRSGLSVRGSAGEGSAIESSATVLLPVRDTGALRRIVRLFLRTL